jgi:DNA-binding MarR family transcriptional regulator
VTDRIDGIVEQWQRERPELELEPLAIVGRLLRAADLANSALGRGVAELGLQPGWFDVLAALRRAGPPYALNPAQLLETMMVTSGGLTKRLDRLAEAGLVERAADPDDRRGTRVRLMPRGKALIDRAIAVHVENEATLLAGLTAAERGTLDGLLRKLLERLEESPL